MGRPRVAIEDLSGRRFGRLEALHLSEQLSNGQLMIRTARVFGNSATKSVTGHITKGQRASERWKRKEYALNAGKRLSALAAGKFIAAAAVGMIKTTSASTLKNTAKNVA